MKKILSILLVIVLCFSCVACSSKPAETPAPSAPAEEKAPTEEKAPAEEEAPAEEAPAADPYEIAVIVKSTNSQSWQYFFGGVRDAATELGDKVVVTEHGAAAESDIEGQLSILEDVIASGPDAIVLTAVDAEACVAPIEEAIAKGIKVITAVEEVNTEAMTAHIRLNSYKGGATLAQHMVDTLNARGVALEGTVGIISAVPVQTVFDRDDGFVDKMKELAPNVKIIEDNYVDNDMQKSMDLALDYVNANPDLIGIFGDNNMTGSGLALAINEIGGQDKYVCVAYDANPEQVVGMEDGSLQALMVIDLDGCGYKAVMTAFDACAGNPVEALSDGSEILVTPENMDDPDIQELLGQ